MRMCRKLVRKDFIIGTTCTLFLFGIVFVVSTRSIGEKSWKFTHEVIIEPGVSDSWVANKRILVCVASAAVYKERRDAIRETWGSHSSLRVVFFLGADPKRQPEVIAEAQKHGDIVQYDFLDTYRNLTLKTASIIQWTHRHRWKQRTLVLKIDDDVFLNAPLLESQSPYFSAPAIYGNFFEDIEPVRDPSSKWYLSYDEYYPAKFPTYLGGAFYILHEKVISPMINHMFDLSYIPVEDVYFTGLVADRARLRRVAFPQNARSLDVPEYNDDPLIAWFYGEVNLELSTVLAVHYVAPGLQRTYWNQVATDSKKSVS